MKDFMGVALRYVSSRSRRICAGRKICYFALIFPFVLVWWLPDLHELCRALWRDLDGVPAGPALAVLSTASLRRRTLSQMVSVPESTELWYYTKRAGCTAAASWGLYTTHSASSWVGTAKVMIDTVTPNYREIVKSGGIVMNPMEIRTLDQPQAVGTMNAQEYLPYVCSSPYQFREQWDWRGPGSKVGSWAPNFWSPTTGIIVPRSVVSSTDIRSALVQAATCCQNKRGRADANLYESMAEVHKTFGLLPGILGNGLKALSSKKGLLNRAKAAGSAYLAYRYGLSPLMMDVAAVVAALSKQAEKLRVRSQCTDAISAQRVETAYRVHDHCRFREVVTTTHQVAIKALSIDEWEMSRMEQFGFTPKGLITLPWELLPYSFVVDWFVNVGDFIGSLVPALGLNQLGSCHVVDESFVVTYSIDSQEIDDPTNWKLLRPVTGSAVRTIRRKWRQPGLPAPSLVVKRDFRFNNPKRVLDALSLVVQRLK